MREEMIQYIISNLEKLAIIQLALIYGIIEDSLEERKLSQPKIDFRNFELSFATQHNKGT